MKILAYTALHFKLLVSCEPDGFTSTMRQTER